MVLHRVHSQILRSHHLFEPLSDEQLDQLMQGSQLLNLEKGDTLFRQGDPAHFFYFVISGAVKIYRLTPDGQEKVFEVLTNRQTFAEASSHAAASAAERWCSPLRDRRANSSATGARASAGFAPLVMRSAAKYRIWAFIGGLLEGRHD